MERLAAIHRDPEDIIPQRLKNGNEDQFPLRRPNARFVIKEETSARTLGNGRDAP